MLIAQLLAGHHASGADLSRGRLELLDGARDHINDVLVPNLDLNTAGRTVMGDTGGLHAERACLVGCDLELSAAGRVGPSASALDVFSKSSAVLGERRAFRGVVLPGRIGAVVDTVAGSEKRARRKAEDRRETGEEESEQEEDRMHLDGRSVCFECVQVVACVPCCCGETECMCRDAGSVLQESIEKCRLGDERG